MQQLNILDDIEENEVSEELALENEEWKEYNLGDLVTLNYGKALPERDRIKGNIPVYSSSGITGWHNKFLTEEKSIIVGRKGSVGTVFYSDQPFFCIDTAYYITENKENYNLKYVYYLLKDLSLDKLNEDSAVPGLNRNTAYAQKFMLPTLKEQIQIAKILSSLDDKIELNQKMNKTLEEMAQAIFKHWFIDFEFPNEEGKPYKSSGGEMVDSELGDIPRDWKPTKLSDIVDSISKTHSFNKNQLIFLNTSDILEGKVLISSYSNIDTLPGQAKKSIKKNDILFTEIRPANKRYAFINFESDDYVVSTKLMVIRTKTDVSPYLIYCYLTSPEVLNELQHQAESRSGTFPQITFDHIKCLDFPIPDEKTIFKLSEIIKSLYDQIFEKSKEIDCLSEIRDSLLPKLMSGEIRTNSSPNPFSPAFKGSKEGGQDS